MTSDHVLLCQDVRLCMSLAKFSYANVPAGSHGPIPWTHISSQNDLFVLLEPYETSDQLMPRKTRYKFRVLQDPNAHEDLDLHLLACEARRAIEEVQQSLVVGQQPSITIIVKSPCIAMRYPLQDRQVRFTNQDDFNKTLKVFTSMMVPYVEAGNLPLAHPVVAPPNGHLATFDTKPSYYETRGSVREGGQRSTVQEHTSTPATMALRPISQTDNNVTFMPTPPSQPYFQVPSIISQPASNHGSMTVNPRSFIATPFFQSHHLLSGPFTSNSQENNTGHDKSEFSISTYIPRPSTAPVATTRSLNFELPPKRDLPFGRKNKGLVSTVSDVAVDVTGQVKGTHGVATALEKKSSDTIEDPGKAQKRGVGGTKRAPTGSKRKPAAKKPRVRASRSKVVENKSQGLLAIPSSEQQLLPQNQNTAQQHNSTTDQFHSDHSTIVDQNEAIGIARPAHLHAQEQKSTAPAIESQPSHNTTVEDNATLSSKYEITDVPTDNSTEPARSTHHLRSRQVVKHHLNQSDEPPASTPPTTIPPPDHQTKTQREQHNHQSALEALLNDPDFAKTIPLATESDFNTLSEEQRHVALESWIVQNLEDDNFLRLCKTMEGVWQRIFVKI